MSQPIDQGRRNLIKYGLAGGLTLLISKVVSAANGSTKITASKYNQIVSVRFWPSDVYTRLTIEAEHEIHAKYFNLANPTRFVIDILNSQLNAVVKDVEQIQFADDPIVSGVKVGQFNPTTVRIVIYAKMPVSAQTQTMAPVTLGSVNYKYRYVFDMYQAAHIAKNKVDNEELNDQILALLQLNSDANKVSESQAIATTTRSQELPTISEPATTSLKPSKSGRLLVMIDPGHGGEDPGAIGAQGTKEKHVVLDIAKRLRDLINASDNMRAQLTRNQDIFIPLATRVAIARKAKADIFVSIHADAFTSPAARGSSVFILSDQGASSAFAKYMAVSENNSDRIGGVSFKTHDSMVNRILLDMTQSYTLRKSSKLGQSVLSQLKEINRLHSPYIERAGFAVLKAPDIPSILVESAFVSNPKEEELLRSSSFRQKVAQQVFDGLQMYAKQNYKLA